MSTSSAIIDALVSQLTSTLAAYTVQGYFTQLVAVDVEQLPLAMVFDPAGTIDRSADGELTERVAVGVVLLRAQGSTDAAQMRADVDSARTSIEGTPRLGDIVDWARVSEWQVNETNARHSIGSLIVETEEQL